MRKKNKKLLTLSGTFFIVLLIIPASFLQAISVGESIFNGGDYGLLNKEFEELNDKWVLASGKKSLDSSGRINNCWKVESTTSTLLISQSLQSQEISFTKGKDFGFMCFLKGTKSGDTFRARIKYRYYYYQYIDDPVLPPYPYKNSKKQDTQFQKPTTKGYSIKVYTTKYAYGSWEETSDISGKPWVLASATQKLPSTTVSMAVELEVKNTDGYKPIVYLDDAEISVFTYGKKSEDFEYYHFYKQKTESVRINYGVSATIFEQDTVTGDHSLNEMTLAIDAFGEGSCLEKIELKIEMLPKKFNEEIPFWPFDGYWYTTQNGDLNILSLSGFDNRPTREAQAVQELQVMVMQFAFEKLISATVSLVTANPVTGLITDYAAGMMSEGIVRTMLGIQKPVDNDLDANGGRDYYTKTTWNLKNEFYVGTNKITFVPNTAQVGNFLKWTYKKGQDISLLITGKFFWGHYEADEYGSYYVYDGSTTSSFELEV